MAQIQYSPITAPVLAFSAPDTSATDQPRVSIPEPVRRPVAAWVVTAATFFAPVHVADVTDPPPTPLAATVRIPDQQLRQAAPPTPHDLGWVGPILVPGVQEPFLAGRFEGPDWLRLARPPSEFPAFVAPIEIPGVQVPFKSWESTGPDWLRLAQRQVLHDLNWSGPLYIPDVTTPTPDLSWRGEQPAWIPGPALPPTQTIYPPYIPDVTTPAPDLSWQGSAPDRIWAAGRPPATDLDAIEPLEVPGVQVPFLGARFLGPDWLRLALRQIPTDLDAVEPLEVPGTTVPFRPSWTFSGPDWLRLAPGVLAPPSLSTPVYLPDVTDPVPGRSWAFWGPDRLDRLVSVAAIPDRPLMPPVFEAPEVITLDKWIGSAEPAPRLVRLVWEGYAAPIYVADVTDPPPDLAWRGQYADRVPAAARSVEFPAFAAPIETPGVQVPFLAGVFQGPDWLRLAPGVRPHDTFEVSPRYLADVTTPTPDRSWSNWYPDQIATRTAHASVGLIVTDPTTPSAAPAVTIWYGSAPDLPTRRPWAAAVWGPRTVGAAGLLNVGPGFSAVVPLPIILIQYTALVGPLDVVVAPAPEFFSAVPADVQRILALSRRLGQWTSPIEPPAAVPAPDLTIVVGETTRIAPSFYARAQVLGIPIEPPPPAPDLPQTVAGIFPYSRPRLNLGPIWQGPPPPPIIPTAAWSVHADPRPRRPIVYQWPSYFAPYSLPVPPAVPAPTRGDWAFGGLPPAGSRRVPDHLWWTGPLRVADVTAATPDLSWQGRYPDWLSRRRPVPEGQSVLSFSAALAGLDPSRFGWRGVGPDWLARRTPTQPPADLLLSPTPFPVPDLGWAGTFPQQLVPILRIQGPTTTFDPEPIPNPASPDLAWQGRYPDGFPARRWTQPPASILRPEHEIATIPDLVSLVIAPSILTVRVLPTAARATITTRLFIDIPDIRMDWGGLDMDWALRLRLPPPSQRFWVAEGDRAISPVDWWGVRQDRPPLRLVRPVTEATLPPQGEAITVGQQLRWAPSLPSRLRLRVLVNPGIVSPTVIPPEVPAGGEPCVEIGEGTLTVPTLLAPTAGSPQLLDGNLTVPTLLSPEVC